MSLLKTQGNTKFDSGLVGMKGFSQISLQNFKNSAGLVIKSSKKSIFVLIFNIKRFQHLHYPST